MPLLDFHNVDEEQCRLISPLPRCQTCGDIARPNIHMFADQGWNERMAERQQLPLDTWLAGVNKLVVIEIGAGENIPTIRDIGERQEGVMIRINPQLYYLPPGKGVSLAMGGLEALRLIGAQAKI